MSIKKLITVITLFLFASKEINAQVPSYVSPNSLAAWYSFNGNANDLSLNGFNGIVNNATLTTDRLMNSNSAYSLTSGYIQLPNALSFSNSSGLTLSGWFVYNSVVSNPSYNTLIDLSDGNCDNCWSHRYTLGQGNGGITFMREGSQVGSLSGIISGVAPNAGSWVHLVGVVNTTNSLIALYINGQLSQSVSFSGTYDLSLFNTGSSSKIFGARTVTNFQNQLSGKIDDIGIWSRALTECEIKKLYFSPSFSATASTPSICSGQSLTLTASGVANYIWSSGANTASTVVNPTTSIIYTVTTTYTTGCSDSKTISVLVDNPTITVNSGAICNGQSFTVIPTGANTYTIQGGTFVKTPSVTSTYTVVGTSTAGCVSQTAAISTITVNQNPTITVNNSTICVGETTTLSASGANTYTWSTNANTPSILVSPSVTANYSVSGSSNNCTSTQTLQVLVSPCTGISEFQKPILLSVYPNPNNGEFIIQTEVDMQIDILDQMGRLVKIIEAKTGKNTYVFDNLTEGLYLLKGRANENMYKVIINK
jgi:hypothetical protein